jgi:inner membrane protein
VDPVSHVLFGHAVSVAARRDRLAPGVHAALVIGSLAPDVDAALALRGFDVYLLAHASGTHSAAGSLVEAILLSLLLRLAFERSRWLPLFLASWVGIAGHIVWDLADGSDIFLLKPFSSASFGWHLVSMGEPIVLIVLAIAAVAAWRSASGHRVAVIALAVLLVVVVGKRFSQLRALAVYQRSVPVRLRSGQAAPSAVTISPELGRFFTWTIADRSGDNVRARRVDARTERVEPLFAFHDASAEPLAVASTQLPVVRTFLGLARMPFARIEPDAEDAANLLVSWSDAADCSARGCDVSFGGAFAPDGAAAVQLIRIGALTFKRPAPTGQAGQ